jgi:hypothetical protein
MFRAMGNKLQKYCEYCAGMGQFGFSKMGMALKSGQLSRRSW